MKLSGSNKNGKREAVKKDIEKSADVANSGKQKSSAKKSKLRSALPIIILSVLIVLFAAFALFKMWVTPPPMPSAGLNKPVTPSPNPSAAVVATPSPTAELTPSPTPNDEQAGASYTFAVVGRDKGGSNTDTIMIVKFDTANHKINVVSIPRDTLVNVAEENKRINTLYHYGKMADGDGPKRLMQGLRDMLGFELGNYVIVDLKAFEDIVDAIGGITYNVPVDMFYNDPYQGLYIGIRRGEQLLSGAEALKVVRFRSGYINADIGRIGTQQDFLMTAAKQVLSIGNIPNLPKIIEILTSNVDTNLTNANIAYFATELLKCKSEDISFNVMPYNVNDEIYLTINIPEWLAMINSYLNPYSEQVTERNVNIITKTANGFYSTTGTYANLTGNSTSFNGFIKGS